MSPPNISIHLTLLWGQQWLSTALHLIPSMTGDGEAAQESFRDSVCFRTGETFSPFNFAVSEAIFAGLWCWNKQHDCVRITTNTENKVNYRWPIGPKNISHSVLQKFGTPPAVTVHAPTLSNLTTIFQMGTSNIQSYHQKCYIHIAQY